MGYSISYWAVTFWECHRRDMPFYSEVQHDNCSRPLCGHEPWVELGQHP